MKKTEKKKVLRPRFEVVEVATGKVVKVIDLEGRSPRTCVMVLSGLLRQMDRERFEVLELDTEGMR